MFVSYITASVKKLIDWLQRGIFSFSQSLAVEYNVIVFISILHDMTVYEIGEKLLWKNDKHGTWIVRLDLNY